MTTNTRRSFLGFLAGLIAAPTIPASSAVLTPVVPLSELGKFITATRVRQTNGAVEYLLLVDNELKKQTLYFDSASIAPRENDIWFNHTDRTSYVYLDGKWENRKIKNHGISGAHVSPYTELYNPTASL